MTDVSPPTPFSAMHEIHIIDNIRMCQADEEAEITFYLPRSHGLNPAHVYVHLWADQIQGSFPLFPLSETEETNVEPPSRPCTENKIGNRDANGYETPMSSIKGVQG